MQMFLKNLLQLVAMDKKSARAELTRAEDYANDTRAPHCATVFLRHRTGPIKCSVGLCYCITRAHYLGRVTAVPFHGPELV